MLVLFQCLQHFCRHFKKDRKIKNMGLHNIPKLTLFKVCRFVSLNSQPDQERAFSHVETNNIRLSVLFHFLLSWAGVWLFFHSMSWSHDCAHTPSAYIYLLHLCALCAPLPQLQACQVSFTTTTMGWGGSSKQKKPRCWCYRNWGKGNGTRKGYFQSKVAWWQTVTLTETVHMAGLIYFVLFCKRKLMLRIGKSTRKIFTKNEKNLLFYVLWWTNYEKKMLLNKVKAIFFYKN